MEVTSTTPSRFPTMIDYNYNASGSADTLHLLQQAPGVSVLRQGGITDSSVLSLSGMSGKQLSLILNGMIYETPSGNFDILSLPGEIKSVEIIPSAGGNTGNGQGGVIILKTDNRNCKSKLNFETGSEDYYKTEINLCYKDKLTYNFSSGIIKSKGN